MAALDQTFLTKLILSFLVGSVWITTVTVIAERFGSRFGGFIGGLPSTIVIALLFIGISQSTETAAQAAVMIPLVMGINGFFILVYLALVHRGLIKALVTALILWSIIIVLLILSGFNGFWISLMVWLGSLVICIFVTNRVMDIPHKGGIRVPYTTKQILGRGIVSGFIISTAVLITRLAGPTVGGIFSNFPVIFMSTLYITYTTGGLEFSRAVAKTLMLSAMVNVGVYSFAAHFAYQYFGIITGTLIAIAASTLSAFSVYSIIRRPSL